MKKLLAIFGVMLLGGGAVLATDTRLQIETAEAIYKSENGKYRQYLKDEFKKGIEIHEYVGPRGSGYRVFEEEMRSDGLWKRIYGEGPESPFIDWRLVVPAIDPNAPTTTSET